MSAWIVMTAAVLCAPPGEIAYLAMPRSGAPRMHVVTVATGAVRVIGIEGARGAPEWSPDAALLAYTVRTPDGEALYVTNVDGEQGRLVAQPAGGAADPAWASVGHRLAYTAGHGLDAQIAVHDLASGIEKIWGGGRTSLSSPIWVSERLVRLLIDPEEQRTPSLASALAGARASGELIVAVGCAGAPGAMTTDLLVVSEHHVTEIAEAHMPSVGTYAEFAPAASSEALAFESNDGGDRDIFVISGRSTFDLSNHFAADWMPVWSPDAGAIAFQSFRSGRSGIYQCGPRRAGRVRAVAVESEGDCWAPAWSPDGEWIAYVSDAGGDPAIYVIRPDGSDRRHVSPAGVAADMPAWRPVR